MMAPTAPGCAPAVRIRRVAETSSASRKSVATQQRRREGRELQRVVDRHREQQDERRAEDVETEQHIEQPWRERDDQNADDRQQKPRKGIDRAPRFIRREARSSEAT